jgi:hypothetical protein
MGVCSCCTRYYSEPPRCRICLDDSGELLTPCGCKGSAAFVHEACVEMWRSVNFAKADYCEVCLQRYQLPGAGRFIAVLYRTLLPVFSSLLLVPISVIVADILPRLPRRSRSSDMLGLDIRPWMNGAFGGYISTESLFEINTVLTHPGIIPTLVSGVSSTTQLPFTSSTTKFQLLLFCLSRLGSLGVLARFLFSAKLISIPNTIFGRRIGRAEAVMWHYCASCVALQGILTPRSVKRTPLFMACVLFGLYHLEGVLRLSLRRAVRYCVPWLER